MAAAHLHETVAPTGFRETANRVGGSGDGLRIAKFIGNSLFYLPRSGPGTSLGLFPHAQAVALNLFH
jgi:hypothetical protein